MGDEYVEIREIVAKFRNSYIFLLRFICFYLRWGVCTVVLCVVSVNTHTLLLAMCFNWAWLYVNLRRLLHLREVN